MYLKGSFSLKSTAKSISEFSLKSSRKTEPKAEKLRTLYSLQSFFYQIDIFIIYFHISKTPKVLKILHLIFNFKETITFTPQSYNHHLQYTRHPSYNYPHPKLINKPNQLFLLAFPFFRLVLIFLTYVAFFHFATTLH